MFGAKCDVPDDAAQALFGRKVVKYLAHGNLGLAVQHVAHVLLHVRKSISDWRTKSLMTSSVSSEGSACAMLVSEMPRRVSYKVDCDTGLSVLLVSSSEYSIAWLARTASLLAIAADVACSEKAVDGACVPETHDSVFSFSNFWQSSEDVT